MQGRIREFSPKAMQEFVINAIGVHYNCVTKDVYWNNEGQIVTELVMCNDEDTIFLKTKVDLGKMVKPIGSVYCRGEWHIYELELRHALIQSYEDNFRI